MSTKWISEQFPVHWHVWHNNYQELDKTLDNGGCDLELRDPRGRTALHLAVTLGHLECTKVLLRRGANANSENAKYWSVVQEAVSTGDPELLQVCLQYRDYQRHTRRSEGVPGLLHRLREAPDFYVEMKWEFTSWVPLVSRMCPSDTYRVWKSGPNVRIDTTLLGFDNMNWQRGSRSFIFKGEVDSALMMEIDHDAHQVFSETMRVLPQPPDISFLSPSEDAVAARITSPISTTYVDTEKISFERSKSGLWGWRTEKAETVNGHQCKVFSASNVELVTKTRTEHLTDQDKQKSKKIARTPLESFLGLAEKEEKSPALGASANGTTHIMLNNPCCIKPEEYFDETVDLGGRDVGRPMEQTGKVQKFKAQMWLAETYPLSLQEQVIPIIDLMAASNAHFRKLKDFITLQLPAGFPVKIEIPLFHVLNARITFGNIFGMESPAQFVTYIGEDAQRATCVVEERCFDVPSGYSVIGDIRHERLRDEDDELLQFAIQQSLMEAGTENDQVTLWEALNKSRPDRHYGNLQTEEERMLQRAIEESMRLSSPSGGSSNTSPGDMESPSTGQSPGLIGDVSPDVSPGPPRSAVTAYDTDLRLALELSQREEEEARKLQLQEEEDFERILRLSMTEK